MSQPDLFVGIDVAKDELVIHLHPTGTLWRVANSKTGLAALGRKLTRFADTSCLRIGFEASGGYERKLAILLDRLALTAYLLDPARVRSFARAERQLAKTDPLDAAVIARCVARCTPNSYPMFMTIKPSGLPSMSACAILLSPRRFSSATSSKASPILPCAASSSPRSHG